MKRLAGFVCLLGLAIPALPGEERVDYDMVTKLRLEEFRHSEVMDIGSELMDRIGPRLTGSPQMKEANDWTRGKFAEWGLSNAHLEPWGPFGRGWSYQVCAARMTAPDHAELLTLPVAWTASTNGTVRGAAIHLNVKSKEELEKLKGSYAGKIVFYGEQRPSKPRDKAEIERFDEKDLEKEAQYEMPGGPPRYNREEYMKRRELRRAVDAFLKDEKPLAVVDDGRGDYGTLAIQGLGEDWKLSHPLPAYPQLSMESEHFGRITRLLDRKVPVEIEMDVKTTLIDQDQMQWNTVAEIPGSDRKDEVVMLGAHLDSWHGGTGATDNGAGSIVCMEVVRLLKALNVHPRRTIRVALWSGEEQGLYGSRAYVDQHFASRPKLTKEEEELPWYRRKEKWPLTLKPEFSKLSVYFNLDNGSGKIRGIYAEDNAAAAAIFRTWLEPFHDLGAATVTLNRTGGTDHESFDQVGLPGFQFIQDELDYETRTHHTNMDLYERLVKEDLMQASVVMASFVYNAAMRDGMFPRKPVPKEEPTKTEKPAGEAAKAERAPAPAPTPTPGPK